MFVFGLVVLGTLTSGPTFATKCPSDLSDRETGSYFARRFQEAEVDFETAPDRPARAAALAQMVRASEKSRLSRYVSRSFTARVSEAKGRLFETLVHSDRSLGWAIAYAFAALDGEDLPAPRSATLAGFANARDGASEAAVKRAVERHLAHRGSPLLFSVEVSREVTPANSPVRARFHLTNEVSLGLADGDPRVPLPKWIGGAPEIWVRGFDHKFTQVIDRRVRQAAPRGVLDLTVTVTVRHSPRPIFVELVLNERVIDRTLVSTASPSGHARRCGLAKFVDPHR